MTASTTNYFVRPLSSANQVDGVTTWLWADHEGLHCAPSPPSAPIPTGHLWGWGSNTWVHLRNDPTAPTVGLEVSTRQHVEAEPCTVLPLDSPADYPQVVSERNRFLRCATEDDQERIDALTICVLALTTPTHAVLLGERDRTPT